MPAYIDYVANGVTVRVLDTPTGTPAIEQKASLKNLADWFGSYAVLASPSFSGTPMAPTASVGANTTQIATTAFVSSAVALRAAVDSPGLTGTPTAPTASTGTNTTQLATTAFVSSAIATKAAVDSPALTGTPTAPTASDGTNTTQLATTAFVESAITAVINAAPGALDDLDALAAAIGDDAYFATTMATSLASKAPADLTGLTAETTPVSGDLFYIWDTVAGELKAIDFDNMPGGSSSGAADAIQVSDGAGGFSDSGFSKDGSNLMIGTTNGIGSYIRMGSQFGYEWKSGASNNAVYSVGYQGRGCSLQTLTNIGFNLYGPGDLSFGISTGTSNSSSPDVCLARDAADQWAMRRGSNPNSLAVYSAYTDASNYERIRTYTTTAGDHVIASEAAGTGVVRPITLKVGDSEFVNLSQSGSTPRFQIRNDGVVVSDWYLGVGKSYRFGHSVKISPSGFGHFSENGVAGVPLEVEGGIHLDDLSVDPVDPPNGSTRLWQSDGTDSGDDGDLMMKITDSSGTTKTITLVDFSAS